MPLLCFTYTGKSNLLARGSFWQSWATKSKLINNFKKRESLEDEKLRKRVSNQEFHVGIISWNFHKLLHLSQHLNWHCYQNVPVDQKWIKKIFFFKISHLLFSSVFTLQTPCLNWRRWKHFKENPFRLPPPSKGSSVVRFPPRTSSIPSF